MTKPIPENQRKTKLINPSLQLRLSLLFVGLAAITLLLQFVMMTSFLMDLATRTGDGQPLLADQVPRLLVKVLLVSFALLMPLVMGLGILVTFRIAGPVYRFERHLEAVLEGRDAGPCRIRKGDEFQRLCGLLNDTIAHLRAGESERAASSKRESA